MSVLLWTGARQLKTEARQPQSETRQPKTEAETPKTEATKIAVALRTIERMDLGRVYDQTSCVKPRF